MCSPSQSARSCLPAAFLVGLLTIPAAGDEANILLVGSKPDHPYATHMYAFECQLLKKCLQKNDGVSATYVAAWPPTEQQLESVSAIVFYSSPSGSVVLDPKHREQFTKLMKGKTGFVAIHWGTGVGYGKLSDSPHNRDLFKGWLGGWFRRPPCDIRIGESMLWIVDAQHAIGRGWTGWKIRDEFYLNPVLAAKARPLLEVSVDGTKHVVGWTYAREPGRSVGITLGHFHENFTSEDFRRLLVNSILWAAHVEVPSQGAIVALDAVDVTLPKPPASAKKR